MNGKNFNNYAVANVPKNKVVEINPEELLKEVKEKGVPYPTLNTAIPADKLFDPLLYYPSQNTTSSTKPFNPFYFVRDELIPIYAKCGEELKYNRLNNISADYGESIIMDNICIILEYGLVGFLKQFIADGREEEFYNTYFYDTFQPIGNLVNYALGNFFSENPRTPRNPYSTKTISTIVFHICSRIAGDLSRFIQNIIALGCIDIKKLNKELNKATESVIIKEEDLDHDVSMIISYLTYISRCNLEQISEVVELCVAGVIDFSFTANNLYNQNKPEDDHEEKDTKCFGYHNYNDYK